MPPPVRSGRLRPRAARALAAALALATVATFAGALRAGFVHDDRAYVTGNPALARGLSRDSVAWALSSLDAANWHPATWLSHLLDVSLYGFAPAGHHATSLLLHAASAATLLLLLHRLTGTLWPGAWAAAVFALHPLRVESVAWVAERKDVLSVLLALLTVAAYVRWARAPAPRRFALVIAAYAAGLAAKPMLVSLPLGLLLLDWWPLGRLLPRPGAGAGPRALRLVLEKAPLLLLAAGSAAITLVAQGRAGAVLQAPPPLADRAANAAVAVARYLALTAWPSGLSVFHPLPDPAYAPWQVGGALLLAAAISVAAGAAWRRQPELLFGWLWFLATLAPVLGFVQVGLQAIAERYTYLPHVGLLVGIGWSLAGVARRHPAARPALAVLALAAPLALAALAARQVGFWRDELTLYARAAAVAPASWFARYNLGTALEGRGLLDAAAREYEATLRINPGHTAARLNLGHIRQQQGRVAEAETLYRETVRLAPGDADAWNNLGALAAGRGRRDEAIRYVREALRVDPDNAAARENLGILLGRPPAVR
jgi:tetratricopeptide (TPR) repeat protein